MHDLSDLFAWGVRACFMLTAKQATSPYISRELKILEPPTWDGSAWLSYGLTELDTLRHSTAATVSPWRPE